MSRPILDMSEVEKLARDLGRSATSSRQVVSKAMRGAGMGMKSRMQSEAKGVQRGRVAATINYDVKQGGTGYEVEVGPAKGGAGSLAFFYYGNSKIGPRIPDPIHILEDEADKTERALQVGLAAFLARGGA